MGTIFNQAAADGTWIPFFTSIIDQAGNVKYDDPLPGAAQFCIRSTKKFYDERIAKRKKESSMVLNPKTHQMEKVVSVKEQTMEEILAEYDDSIDYAITGIKDAYWDEERERPIKCTRADKLKLKDMTVFDRFLKRAWQIIEEQEVKHSEALEKNLQTTQCGDPVSVANPA
jgi:hypothetical protein